MKLVPYTTEYYDKYKPVIEMGLAKTKTTVPDVSDSETVYSYFVAQESNDTPLGVYAVFPKGDGVAEVGVRLWSCGLPKKLTVQAIAGTLHNYPKGLLCRVFASNMKIRKIVQRLGFTYRGQYKEQETHKMVQIYTLSAVDFMTAIGGDSWQQK